MSKKRARDTYIDTHTHTHTHTHTGLWKAKIWSVKEYLLGIFKPLNELFQVKVCKTAVGISYHWHE